MYVFECIRTYIVRILCPSFFCTYRPVFACIHSYMRVFLLVTSLSCVSAFTPKTRIIAYIRKNDLNFTCISIKNTNNIRTYTTIYGCPYVPKPVRRPDFQQSIYVRITYVFARIRTYSVCILRTYMCVYVCISCICTYRAPNGFWNKKYVHIRDIQTYTYTIYVRYTYVYVRIRTFYVRI